MTDTPVTSSTPTAVGSDSDVAGRHLSSRLSGPMPAAYFDFGEPPTYEAYSTSVTSGTPLATEKNGVRRKEGVLAKRGGWKRIAIIAIVLLIILAVGLGVGLGVGLSGKSSSSSQKSSSGDSSSSSSTSSGSSGSSGSSSSSDSSSPSSSGSTANDTSDFPIGSYAIETFLDTVATDCTANASTWLCYPYSTYAESPSDSAATFNWIIEAKSEGSSDYTISSTSNPFSIVFSQLALTLHDEGESSERYTFQTELEKTVIPTVALTDDNSATFCNYTTTFQGTLYTQMTKSYPDDNSSDNSTYAPWPYAVRVEQVAGSGDGQPICYDSSDNIVGNFSIESNAQLCDCLYLNYGT